MFLATLVVKLETPEEKQTISELYMELRFLCHRYAMKVTQNTTMAEDAVHNAFESIIKNKKTFFALDKEQQKSYIFIAVKRKAIDLMRGKDESEKSYLDDVPEIADNFDIYDVVENEESYQNLVNHIKTLPDIYRDIFQEKYLRKENRTNKEIAKELGISEKAVSKRIIRAKTMLLEKMGKGVIYEQPTA
ncbi:MAG: sigma-70 family RNA polymerase sigma factor [Defluviitaleaceae bacterium]|nr:sigma-70 family RNA polymerase sigma factor [Defluviitaleaceae bacterium]